MNRLPAEERQGETTNGLIKRLPSKQDGTTREGSCKKGSFFVLKIIIKNGRAKTARVKTQC